MIVELTTRHPAAVQHAFDAGVGVAAATALVAFAEFAVEEPVGAGSLALSAATGLALAGWRTFPIAQFVVALGATLLYSATGGPGGPIYAVAFASALVMVAGARDRPWLPLSIAGAVLFLVVEVLVDGWSALLFLIGAIWFVGPVLFGEAVRLRRARLELAERSRAERARREVVEERLRIARDVHDVVGHSLATIALQAGVAEHLSGDERAREALSAIRRLSRESLAEVGAMLDVLRDGAVERAPTPDLSQVPRLVADMRDAGLAVSLERDGDGAAVPELVGAAAYRIVQEALTNVVRHAGAGAAARVRVVRGVGRVEVEVSDDGRGPTGSLVEGKGLAGMRERAAALGGSFSAGGSARGGFVVRALLPLT